MKLSKNKNSLSREQAAAIYEDLQKSMKTLLQKQKAAGIPPHASTNARITKAAPPVDDNPALPTLLPTKPNRGHMAALGLVLFFALGKVCIAVLESTGVLSVSPVQASMLASTPVVRMPAMGTAGGFSKEEAAILTALDSRRSELEERDKRMESQQEDLDQREREFAARQTQLKELTDTLRSDRDRGEKKRSQQIDQLANVYGSMNPPEAASLIEQLDVTIALELLERMPEKRIGQILALMSPARALTITRLLSGKIESR